MKYVLILYLCSLIDGQCGGQKVMPFEYPSHYHCAIAGHQSSVNELFAIGKEAVNEGKIAIQFECKQITKT